MSRKQPTYHLLTVFVPESMHRKLRELAENTETGGMSKLVERYIELGMLAELDEMELSK